MLPLSMVESPTKVTGNERSEMISVVQLCGVSFLGSQLYSIAAVPYTTYRPGVAAMHTVWGKG